MEVAGGWGRSTFALVRVRTVIMQVIYKQGKSKKTGNMVKIPVLSLSESEYHALNLEYAGFCLKCGEVTESGVEPDAEAYTCESCNKPGVYGIDQSLLYGRIEITD